MTKAEEGNWDEDFKEDENSTSEKNSQQDTRKTEYMDMTKPGEYKIRLVGRHVKCRKRFKPYRSTVQMNEKDLDIAWSRGWPAPGKRYAANVIDKTGLKEGETGKLKVLEKGPSVFKNFAHYKAIKNIDPAGKEGPNFSITVKIPRDKNGEPIKLLTEYSVMPLDTAPFTADEIKMIKEQKLWPLKEIYKSTSPEKIQELWDALSDEQKTPPKREEENSSTETPSKTPPIEDEMAGAPANSDDLFDEKEGDQTTDSGELF